MLVRGGGIVLVGESGGLAAALQRHHFTVWVLNQPHQLYQPSMPLVQLLYSALCRRGCWFHWDRWPDCIAGRARLGPRWEGCRVSVQHRSRNDSHRTNMIDVLPVATANGQRALATKGLR